MTQKTIMLDVNRGGYQGNVTVKQGDTASRTLVFALTASGAPVFLNLNDTTVVMRGKLGESTYLGACTVREDGQAEYTLESSFTAAAGQLACELTVYKGTVPDQEVLYSPWFTLTAEPYLYSDSELEAQDNYSGLATLVNRAAAAATDAETAEAGAQAAQLAAETAQAGAVAAQGAAETAQAGAVAAQGAAETAQTGAEAAQVAAETAQTEAVAAQTTASSASLSASGYADSASDSASSALSSKNLASGYAGSAASAMSTAVSAKTAAENASSIASSAASAANTSKNSAASSATSAANAKTAAEAAQIAAETAETNAEAAQAEAESSAEDALTSENNSEAWAVGTKNGVAVVSGDAQYNNSAKYHAEQAAAALSGTQDKITALAILCGTNIATVTATTTAAWAQKIVLSGITLLAGHTYKFTIAGSSTNSRYLALCNSGGTTLQTYNNTVDGNFTYTPSTDLTGCYLDYRSNVVGAAATISYLITTPTMQTDIAALEARADALETRAGAIEANVSDIEANATALESTVAKYTEETVLIPTSNLCDESTIAIGSWWSATAALVTNSYTTRYRACAVDVTGLSNVVVSAQYPTTYPYPITLYNYFFVDASNTIISSGTWSYSLSQKVSKSIEVPSGATLLKFNVQVRLDGDAMQTWVVDGTVEKDYETFGNYVKVDRFQSAVIDNLQNQIDDFFIPINARIILSGVIYAVIGDTVQLFYKSFIEGDLDDVIVSFSCSKGKNYPRYWEYTPASGESGTYAISVTLYDILGNEIDTKACSLIVSAAANPATSKNILCVGDSTMQSGQIPIEASRRIKGTTGVATSPAALSLSNYNFVGRKQNADETVGWEGTGGWTFSTYMGTGAVAIRFTVTDALDVAMGARYTYGSFTLEVSEINVTEGAGNIRCVFYITTPYTSAFDSYSQSGTLTLSGGGGQSSITFSAWVKENYQPFWNSSTNSFDISNYATLYCGGQLDAICVLLGVNSLIGIDAFSSVTSAVDAAKSFFNLVHADLADCKIIASTIPLPSSNGGIAANYSASGVSGEYSAKGFEHRVQEFNQLFLALNDDDDYNGFVTVVNVHAQFDADNGYPTTTKALNTRVSTTETLQSNAVHPRDEGYWQLADALAFRPVLGLIN